MIAVVLALLAPAARAPAARTTVEPARAPAIARPAGADVASDWMPVWGALERLEELPRESADYASLRAQLLRAAARRESAARERGDRELALRSRVLAAHIARLDGLDVRRVRDPGILLEFLPGEAWLCAQALLAGPLRTSALIAAFDDPRNGTASERSALARATIEADLHDLRLADAEAIARAWLARGEDVVSGVLLAGVLRAAGRSAEARDLLGRLEDGARTTAERRAWAEERARAASAAGDEEAALDALGSALAAGSTWAASELAWRGLDGRDRSRALALARPFLDDDPHGQSARRIWALGLSAGELDPSAFAPHERAPAVDSPLEPH